MEKQKSKPEYLLIEAIGFTVSVFLNPLPASPASEGGDKHAILLPSAVDGEVNR